MGIIYITTRCRAISKLSEKYNLSLLRELYWFNHLAVVHTESQALFEIVRDELWE